MHAVDDMTIFARVVERASLSAAGRELQLMFPMVTEVGEFERARAIVEREQVHLARHGYAAAETVRLGAMLEVPALLWQLDELFATVDFLSVGSNDLMQFMMASDRGNTRLATRFDPLSPAFLRALRKIADKGLEHDKPVTLCGEIAGRPLEALALAGIGYRALSMAPAAIGPVKTMLRALELRPLSERLATLIDEGVSASDVRTELRALAEAQRIPV